MPEARFAPAVLRRGGARPRRIAATIAQVVVLPFVAETRALPSGSARRAARRVGRERREHASRAASCRRRGRVARESAPTPGGAQRGREPTDSELHGTAAARPLHDGNRHAASRAEALRLLTSAREGRLRSDGRRVLARGCTASETIGAGRGGTQRGGRGTRRSRTSTPSGWPRSGPACASATATTRSSRAARLRRAPRPLAHDARVRRRPRDDGASADRDRALRLLERRQAPGRPRAAPLRDARGAARPPARAGRRARAHPDGAGPRDAPRHDALEVALLAHLRLAQQRAARGRLRRPRRRGAPRPRDRAGRLAGDPLRPPAEVLRLGRGAQHRTRACSPSGRSTGCSRRAAARGRRSSSSSASSSRAQGVDVGPDGHLARTSE